MTPIDADLTGSVAVVTGATAGIGYELVSGLAGLGATVVLVGRSPLSAQRARSALISGGIPADRLQTAAAELSRPAQVAGLAAGLRRRHPRISVLINNAAVYPAGKKITPDGFEESWATNVLAYEILTTMLAGPLAAAGGRVVYTSSAAPFSGGLDVGDLLWEHRRYRGVYAYRQTKQAINMLAWAWERRLADLGVTINVANPDGTSTGIADRQRGLWGVLIRWAFRHQERTPAEGADTSLWLAAGPDVGTRASAFYMHRGPTDCRYRNDVAAYEALWDVVQAQIAPYIAPYAR
jgi:NAD(P)-dependent dehydrogenase (short-subunit alcohol dehydrogenase family)